MKKRIVIVGGGIAGLSAASFLVRTGCHVTLLEATARFGGRIHTIVPEDAPVELGAEFLHGESETIRNVIRAAELSTHPVSGDYQTFCGEQFQRVKLLEKIAKIIHRVDIRHGDRSFQDFLDAQHLDATDRDQALGFVEGFHAAHPGRISAHSLRRGEYAAEHMAGTGQGRINEGYGALVHFLESEVRAHGGKMVCNAVVEKVRWESGRVEITFQHGDHEIVIADAAVITLPLGVLKAGTVKFQPPLAVKQEAIGQLHFGNVVKVIFQFRQRCWPDFGFIVALDEPFPTWWTDPRGPTLTAWAGGPKADRLLDRSPEELAALGLEILRRFFPGHATDIAAQFISVQTFDWAHDPFTRGAYSYLPVNGLDLPKLLGAPIADTLFFAGEATVTDAQTGTVFGAFETGLRAGREILATMTDTTPPAVLPLQK